MKRLALISTLFLLAGIAFSEQPRDYDYFAANRTMIRNGVQAILMCNGLFTSHRTLEQVFDQELMYLASARFGGIVDDASGGEYEIDRKFTALVHAAFGWPQTLGESGLCHWLGW